MGNNSLKALMKTKRSMKDEKHHEDETWHVVSDFINAD